MIIHVYTYISSPKLMFSFTLILSALYFEGLLRVIVCTPPSCVTSRSLVVGVAESEAAVSLAPLATNESTNSLYFLAASP